MDAKAYDRSRRMVYQEVQANVSALVSTLASGAGYVMTGTGNDKPRELSELAYQAQELCEPVLDYEESARQAGWANIKVASKASWYRHNTFRNAAAETDYADTAQEACEQDGLDPDEREVFEHWAVSDWLAAKLTAAGERVAQLGGLNVWARTTTGQALAADAVMIEIARSWPGKP